MKHLYFFLTLLLPLSLAAQKGKKVVVFEIREEIAPSATRITLKALSVAREQKADYLIIHMDTYGGLVTDADTIRKALMNAPMPVYVWVENNAASAGALISLACDKIFMKEGSSMGAATVVNQSGEAVPDKYQSYMRGKMRATAESHGKDTVIENGDTLIRYRRDPRIAEAMVDPDLSIEGLIDSGKVLTFTPEEAINNRYCEGMANSLEEVLKLNNLQDAQIIKVEKSTLDKIVGFFANPAISGILLLVIFAGIYFELQTPGIGFPLLIAGIAAVLYLIPLYLDGLAANWEILMLIAGVALLIVEIFVTPGFGVAGISGIILLLTGLTLSMIRNVDFDFSMTPREELIRALTTLVLALVGFIVLAFAGIGRFLQTGLFRKIVLEDTLSGTSANPTLGEFDLTGMTGIAFTDIRPFGKIFIDEKLFPVKSLGEYYSKDSTLLVIGKEGNYWLVEKK